MCSLKLVSHHVGVGENELEFFNLDVKVRESHLIKIVRDAEICTRETFGELTIVWMRGDDGVDAARSAIVKFESSDQHRKALVAIKQYGQFPYVRIPLTSREWEGCFTPKLKQVRRHCDTIPLRVGLLTPNHYMTSVLHDSLHDSCLSD